MPYSYPTGVVLKAEATRITMAGNGAEIGLLAKLAPRYNIDVNEVFKFRKLLVSSPHDQSIDAVIQANSDPRLGIDIDKMVMAAKLITALLIIKCESNDLLKRKDENWGVLLLGERDYLARKIIATAVAVAGMTIILLTHLV